MRESNSLYIFYKPLMFSLNNKMPSLTIYPRYKNVDITEKYMIRVSVLGIFSAMKATFITCFAG